VAETRRNKSEAINESTDAGREETGPATDAAQDATVVGLDGVRRVTEQVTQALGVAGQKSEELTRQATEKIGTLAETGTVLTRGMQEVSRELLRLSQHGLQKNIEGLTQLARCRTMKDLVAVQSDLMRNNWQYMFDVNRWFIERTIEIASEAAQRIDSETRQDADRTRRAAA
jgi:hypothetical protein